MAALTDVGDAVARLERELLERVLVCARVEQLQNGVVSLVHQLDEDLLPESVCTKEYMFLETSLILPDNLLVIERILN